MRLSTLAVAVSLALGAGLLTGCDRGPDDATRAQRPAGSGSTTAPGPTSGIPKRDQSSASSSSPAATPSGSASTDQPKDSAAGGASAPSSSSSPAASTEPEKEKKQ